MTIFWWNGIKFAVWVSSDEGDEFIERLEILIDTPHGTFSQNVTDLLQFEDMERAFFEICRSDEQ